MEKNHLSVFVFLVVVGLTYCNVVNLSCNDIKSFVDGHNSRRLKLANDEVSGQPAASQMNYIIWDAELAEKASDWASNGKFQHNPDKSIPSNRFETGENIYMTSSSDMDFKINMDSALEAWFSENKDYKYGALTPSQFTSDRQIGHYTQMVWSDSIYLGCGVSESVQGGWKNYYVVCNYGPAGNVIGEAPYEANGGGSGKLDCEGECSSPYGETCQ